MRREFYEVVQDSYLFRSKLSTSDERKQREEPVRQWAAFELIRAYGLSVANLDFERTVKVGSVNYRIDILVHVDGRPWAVIECKERSYTKHDKGLEQAVSYANAEGIRAEFALYTNGGAWLVKRRVNDRWVGVPELPITVSGRPTETIVFLLGAFQDLCPLLYQVGQPTDGGEARRYMEAMQRFFGGANSITLTADKELLHATDNLLRVLQAPHWDAHYRHSKLSWAYKYFEDFTTNRRLAAVIPPFGSSDLHVEMLHLHAALMTIAESFGDLEGIDVLLLRLNVALTEYGQSLGLSGKRHPRVEQHLHQALREFLAYGLRANLNLTLPDVLDRIWEGDVRRYCENAWKTFDADPHPLTTIEIGGMFIRQFFNTLLFWRRHQ